MQDQTPTPQKKEGTPEEEAKKSALVRNKYADKMNQVKKKLPKKVKIAIWALLGLAVVSGSIFLFQKSKDASQTDLSQQTATVQRGLVETYVEGYGRTAAKVKYDLGKDLKGTVTEVKVSSGDSVKKGDVLMIVDPTTIRKELDTAISELDDAQRAVDEATSALQKAKKNANHLTITTPFAGKVLPMLDDKGMAKTYKIGQTLGAGEVLATMVDDATMRLPLYFSSAYKDAIRVGAAATVSIPASMSSVPGKVIEVEKSQRISDDGVVLFRVILSMQNPGTLKKDMIATASVQSAQGELMPAESGKLAYAREEEITVQSGGTIQSINNLEYYRYPAGAVLCKLENEDTLLGVGTAERSLETAHKTVESKETRVSELQKLVNDATVISPIDGIVLSMNAQEGDKLEGNTIPCTVADLSSLIVKADISELDFDKVKVGLPVRLSLDGDESMTYNGTVESISLQSSNGDNQNQGDSGSNLQFPAVIRLDSIENLRPEQSISYKIITASKEDCLYVPTSAIVYTDDGTAVYVKEEAGKEYQTMPAPEGSTIPKGFVLVPVKTGIFDDTNTEIISGLDEGETVYLAGPTDAFAGSNEVELG